MQMEDGLPGARADVEHGAISLLDVAFASDLGGGEMTAPDEFRVRSLGFFQSRKMFFGDDEHVRGRFRVDVFEPKDVLVFINFFRGNFTPDDATEKAAGSGIGHSLLSFHRMMRTVKGTTCRHESCKRGLGSSRRLAGRGARATFA